MVACLDSLLELLNGLSCGFLWNTMLYHIVDVPIKYLVKVDCGSTNGMVSNHCITLKLLCKHQFCGAYVYSDQHFAYVLTFYVHCTVCGHFLPTRKLKPYFHYSIGVYSHHDNQSHGEKFKSDLQVNTKQPDPDHTTAKNKTAEG